MPNDNWYFNRLGKMAPVSSLGSAVPDYGLTFDTAVSANWESPLDFNALVTAQQIQSQTAQPAFPQPAPAPAKLPPAPKDEHKSLWDKATGIAGDVGGVVAGAVGAVTSAVDAVTPGDLVKADEKKAIKGLTGWERYKALTMYDLGKTAKAPGVAQLSWATTKASEYAATVEVAATKAQQQGGKGLGGFGGLVPFTDGSVWRTSHQYVKGHNLSAGEGFAQMFYDDEILDDEKRLQQVRQHSTAFNATALAFNVIAGVKYDPNVLVGKGLGAARAFTRGDLATEGAAVGIQHEVIGAGLQNGRSAAEKVARNQTGIANRLRANHALTLFDRSVMLRQAAQDLTPEQFIRMPAFRRSVNGSVMAQLMRETAHSDDEWGLVFRTAMGDPDALTQLRGMRGEVSDKIAAIERNQLPAAESELDTIMAKIDARSSSVTPNRKRLAELRGKFGIEDQMVGSGYRDWLLDTDRKVAETQVDHLTGRFLNYQSAHDWLDRATRGVDNSAQTNSIFGGLHGIPSGNGIAQGFGKMPPAVAAMAGKVQTWQHDAFSPVVRLIHMPQKPFLRRVGVVDLNQAEAGIEALDSSMTQLDHVMGRSSKGFRDQFFEQYAAARTDVSRANLLAELHHRGMAAIGSKYGLDGAALRNFSEQVLEKRRSVWAEVTDQTRWRRMAYGDKTVNVFPWIDDHGGMNLLHAQPQDVTELANHFPMANWVDLDHTLRMNRDLFQELGTARSTWLKGRRELEARYDQLGSAFNALWKPLALISIRWPLRVLGDEGLRIQTMIGTLPHMWEVGKELGNTAYNRGVSKPFEYVAGRKWKTGPLGAETNRTAFAPFDQFDARGAENPTGSIPAHAADYHKIDQGRYDKLEAANAERLNHVRKGPTVGKAKWHQQWEDRLAAAEAGDRRGFFFDPATHKASNRGFAVSPYPGRLRTFEAKPSASDLVKWERQNTDLLSIPNNRVGVWLDKDTSRWHLDVVRTHARREDAMQYAVQSEANEFFDIGQGFTRYVDQEDPFQHYQSPFVPPSNQPDMPSSEGVEAQPVQPKKAVGYGTRTFRAGDGSEHTIDAVYGPAVEDGNIWAAANSGQEMGQAMYSSYTRTTARRRSLHTDASGVFRPGEVDSPESQAWGKAWEFYVNRHVRQSPVWLRMLNGQSDAKLTDWLYSAEGRTMVRERLGHSVVNPHEYVQVMRAKLDSILPTDRAKIAARDGDVSAKTVDELIPHEMKNQLEVGSIADLNGQRAGLHKFVGRIYRALGSLPNDKFVRHPFANVLYDTRMRNYIASLPDGTKLTPEVLNAAEATARAFANKQIKRLLYNIADDNQGTHLLRFIAPFAQAQYEVLDRYTKIFMDNPASLARLLFLYNKSQTSNAFWQVVDKDNKPTTDFSHDNQIVVQVTPWMRKFLNHIPVVKNALDYQGGLTIPVSSADLIFQGGDGAGVLLPSLGPIVQFPASELYFRDHAWQTDKGIGKLLFPYGMPKGGNAFTRAGNSFEPAYLRRIQTALMNDYSDSAYAGTVKRILDEQQFAYEKGTRKNPASVKEAERNARALYILRAAASFGSPVPFQGVPLHQYHIDRYRELRNKDPQTADEKFFDTYGAEFFRFASEASKSLNGLAPTENAMVGYRKYKDLIDESPEMAGLVVGPYANNGDFSSGVYQWQLSTRLGPGSKRNMREFPDPEQQFKDEQVGRGWVEYSKLQASVDAELRRRGLTSIMNNGAEDIYRAFQTKKREIIDYNPAWEDAYDSRAAKVPAFIRSMNKIAGDDRLDGRTDIEGLRAYLISRQQMRDTLIQRQQAGVAQSASLYWAKDPQTGDLIPSGENEVYATQWQSYVSELTAKNPLFAEIYHRYLEDDDLSAGGTQW